MEPITRRELFMAKAAGEYDGELPEPRTRQEIFLEKIAGRINTMAGGGGGDNDFVVTYTTQSGNLVCNKTAAEIYDALEAGKNVRAQAGGEFILYPVDYAKDSNNRISIVFATTLYYAGAGPVLIEIGHEGGTNEADHIEFMQKVLLGYELLERVMESIESYMYQEVQYQITTDAESGDIQVGTTTDTDWLRGYVENKQLMVARVDDSRMEADAGFVTMPCIESGLDYDNDGETITQYNIKFSAIKLDGSGNVVACFITHVITPNAETGGYSNTITYEEKILTVQAS